MTGSVRRHKMVYRLIGFLGMLLLAEFIFVRFFPGWNFTSPAWIKVNRVGTLFACFLLFFCFLLLRRTTPTEKIFLGVLLLPVFAISAWLLTNPIDTYTLPEDRSTLLAYPDGKKQVVREYRNAKTNRPIRDTVLVRDVFIFRQVLGQ